MKESAKYTTRTYEVGGGYMVDIVDLGDELEAWIYEVTNGVKLLMFGMMKDQVDYEEFLQMVEDSLDEHMEAYAEEYVDGAMHGVM